MVDSTEEIRSRLGIYELVSQYVQLKKAGVNYKGLCPFHSEKTPSFIVSPEKQIFHCFGCHKGGDIFTFIQEVEGVEFPEAIQILADKAGVKIDSEKYFKKEGKSEKDEYYKAHEIAMDLFENQLYKTKDGGKVLEYLYKRGLKDSTIKEFHLGFAPDSFDFLHPYLLKKGISRSVLFKSGLVSSKSLADEKIYDKFRGRLMFPIFDYMGRVCGFGGRVLSKDQIPKYLNSPENIIYSKSKVLYGLSHSKKSIKEKGEIILVEGYFDVLVPYQEGVNNIVATSGTALTTEQIRLIKRFTTKVVSCFDTDKAGFEATRRAYELLHKAGVSMRTVVSFKEKDPADFVLDSGGNAFSEFIAEARDFLEFFIDKLTGSGEENSLDGRKKILSEFGLLFRDLSPVEKDFYVRKLAIKMGINNQIVFDELANLKSSESLIPKIEEREMVNKTSLNQIIFSLVLKYPELYEIFRNGIDENELEEDFKSIYKGLTDQYNRTRDEFKGWTFDEGILAKEKEKIDILLLFSEDRYGGFSEETAKVEMEKLIDKVKKERRNKKLREIKLKIDEAEALDQKDKVMELLRAQSELQVEKEGLPNQ